MKKILIDCSLTGGRGPAKKTTEFIWECQSRNINYLLLCDKKLSLILRELNITPDIIADININDNPIQIYSLFNKLLRQVKLDYLIKFGARTPGPYYARKNNIPYIIVDGGLPDKYEIWPSLYDKETYCQAEKYILTSNFPYKPDTPLFLKNLAVCYYPLSQDTQNYIYKLKSEDKKTLINQFSNYLTPFPPEYDLIINLNMTDDYVDDQNRITYGSWLKAREYDQTVGFIRRLVADLGMILNDKRIVLITDKKINKVCPDLYQEYKNVCPVTWKNQWNYYCEIGLDAISDITIARAANYQPYIFALSRGNNITTAVPANGYMNEDTAAIQMQALNLTVNLTCDDDQYINKLVRFYKNKILIQKISASQEDNFKKFGQKNNTINTIFSYLKSYL